MKKLVLWAFVFGCAGDGPLRLDDPAVVKFGEDLCYLEVGFCQGGPMGGSDGCTWRDMQTYTLNDSCMNGCYLDQQVLRECRKRPREPSNCGLIKELAYDCWGMIQCDAAVQDICFDWAD